MARYIWMKEGLRLFSTMLMTNHQVGGSIPFAGLPKRVKIIEIFSCIVHSSIVSLGRIKNIYSSAVVEGYTHWKPLLSSPGRLVERKRDNSSGCR